VFATDREALATDTVFVYHTTVAGILLCRLGAVPWLAKSLNFCIPATEKTQ